ASADVRPGGLRADVSPARGDQPQRPRPAQTDLPPLVHAPNTPAEAGSGRGSMNAPDRQTPRAPNDWFDEPEPRPPRASRVPAQVDPDAQTHEQAPIPLDDWLAPEPLMRHRPSRPRQRRRSHPRPCLSFLPRP